MALSISKKILAKILKLIFLGVLFSFTLLFYLKFVETTQQVKETIFAKKDYLAKTQSAVIFLDRNGQELGRYHPYNQTVVPLEDLSINIVNAFVAAEDERFFSHIGIDPLSIIRSIHTNLTHGQIIQGASTITQQLARMIFLNQGRTFERKINELFLALSMERVFSKKELLEWYLSKIFLGFEDSGVSQASRFYFGKSQKDLTLDEAALLAGLARSPKRYHPKRQPEAALKRRNIVLNKMFELKMISEKDLQDALNKPLEIMKTYNPWLSKNSYGYALNMAKRDYLAHFSQHQSLQTSLYIKTTFDKQILDDLAEAVLKKAKGKGVEGAGVVYQVSTQKLLAIQGGRDFERSSFNRALYTKKDVGTLILPLYLQLALEKGYHLSDDISKDPNQFTVHQNSKNHITLEQIVKKETVSTIEPLYTYLGKQTVEDYFQKLGFIIPKDGSSYRIGVTSLKNLAKAYLTVMTGFANHDSLVMTQIVDQQNRILWTRPSVPKTTIQDGIASLLAFPIESKNTWVFDRFTLSLQDDNFTALWTGFEHPGLSKSH